MLAQHAITPLYDSGRMDEAAKAEARSILARMDYGDGGYFFAYDLQGALLVHPRTPERVGMNRLAYRLVVAAYNISRHSHLPPAKFCVRKLRSPVLASGYHPANT